MRMLSWALAGKRVFVRADLNTHLEPELFMQSLKFQRSLHTLRYLKAHGARVTLATHIDRPHGYDPRLSTQQLVDYFIQVGFSCVWSDIEGLEPLLDQGHDLLLLENVRFYPQKERQSVDFARKITKRCDFFVEDGFGVLARNDSSSTTAAGLFNPADRSYGFLVQHELAHLKFFKDHAKKPYLLMIGGGKGLEKLESAYHFFDTATHIALCPGVSELPESASFVRDARAAAIDVLMPLDYLMYGTQKMSIGPETYLAWKKIIMSMRTIVFNGLMGMLELPETTQYSRKLFELFVHAGAHDGADIVIAGGDSTLAAQLWGSLGERIYLSTGGGSTLKYLSGQPLPGLAVLGDVE